MTGAHNYDIAYYGTHVMCVADYSRSTLQGIHKSVDKHQSERISNENSGYTLPVDSHHQ